MRKIITVDQIRSDIACTAGRKSNVKERDSKESSFTTIQGPLNHRIWQLPPINLSPKNYFNTQQKDKCVKNKMNNASNHNKSKISLQVGNNECRIREFKPSVGYFQMLQAQQKLKQKKPMVTRFRIDSANTDRRKTLRNGFHEKGKYSQPRPRHFNDDIHRPLDTVEELEKEDFLVQLQKDPGNINFKNETLKLTIPELTCRTTNTSRDITGLQMNTKKMQEPKFDSNLLLAKSTYQKGRSTQDVLYTKVAEITGLFPIREKFPLDRPDIKDNKTIDFLEITRNGPRHKCMNCC